MNRLGNVAQVDRGPGYRLDSPANAHLTKALAASADLEEGEVSLLAWRDRERGRGCLLKAARETPWPHSISVDAGACLLGFLDLRCVKRIRFDLDVSRQGQ